jgi:RNA polymerase sigma-70 factor, ECF subfamily
VLIPKTCRWPTGKFAVRLSLGVIGRNKVIADSDRELIQRARQNTEEGRDALGQLWSRYEGRLRAFIRKRLGSQHPDVDDVLSETFIGLQNSLPTYDPTKPLQTWLFTIAHNKSIDRIRRISRQPVKGGADEATTEQMGRTADRKQRKASSMARSQERRDQETSVLTRGLSDLIKGYFVKKDFDRVRVLELLFVKSWTNKLIAERLSIAEQTVANYRFAAVRKLEEHVKTAKLDLALFPEIADELARAQAEGKE